MQCERGRRLLGCALTGALIGVLLGWLGHAAWFWYRVESGGIIVDIGCKRAHSALKMGGVLCTLVQGQASGVPGRA